MKDEIILQINNLYKDFNIKTENIRVLTDVNLEVRKNDFLVIYGPSGCGKSTLLNIILGLEEPTSGTINFMGNDVYSFDYDKRTELRKNNIGVIYQQPNWIKSLNVLDNVALGASIIGVERIRALDKAKAMLQLTGMLDWADFRPMDLSSGQQQKVALARALMNDPELIVADEPTGNLDVHSGEELMELFLKLNNTNKTIIMVTHNVENIAYAHSVVQIIDGHLSKSTPILPQNIRNIKISIVENLNIEVETKAVSDPELVKDKNSFKEYTRFKNFEKFLIAVIKMPINIFQFFVFFCLLNLNVILHYLVKIFRLSPKHTNKLNYKITKFINIFSRIFNFNKKNTISNYDLMYISLKNLLMRKSRTFLTIIGISIGIGIIVLLLSVGYGLEKLIVSKVATNDDAKQIQASPAVASNVKIMDSSISDLKSINGISEIYPVLNVIGNVSYNSFHDNVAVFGVPSGYFKSDSVKTGRVFTDMQNDNRQKDIINSTLSDTDQVKTIEFSNDIKNEIVVNEALLQMLNLNKSDAVNQKISISFLSENPNDNITVISANKDFVITGVTNGNDLSPEIFIPLGLAKYMNSNSYSFIEIVAKDTNSVSSIRKIMETKGYATTSINDTIEEINSLFATLRIIFGIVGSIALSVALLGMVNTMTVSLMERTHEIGLLKALGMKSFDVENLFLTEAIVIGISGGVFGLAFGFFSGKFLSLVLSIFAISKGYSSVDITYLPFVTITIILIMSFVVGVLAGYYPAKRAKNISVLEALRFE